MPDSANLSNGAFDPATSYARISERVENQGRDIVDLRSNMNTGFRNLESSVLSLSNEIRGNSRTQWPVIWSAIGVSFAVLAAVGALAYRPVLSNQDRLEAAFVRQADTMTELAKNTVSRQEMDWRAARGQEDRMRSESAIAELRTDSVSRSEWSERSQAVNTTTAELNRRIDEMRQEIGAVYGTRDVIQDMKKEIDTLRQRLAGFRSGAPPS